LAKKSLSADFDQPLWLLICREKLGAWLEFRSLAARYHFRALSFLNVPVLPIGGHLSRMPGSPFGGRARPECGVIAAQSFSLTKTKRVDRRAQ
jgi:hypothetical protein